MDFNPSLFEIDLSFFLPSTSPQHPQSCCWWYFKSEGPKSHQDFWGRLTVTVWGMTADPWTACNAGASVSAFCVIRTNIIKCLAWIHRSIWRKHIHAFHTVCLKNLGLHDPDLTLCLHKEWIKCRSISVSFVPYCLCAYFARQTV